MDILDHNTRLAHNAPCANEPLCCCSSPECTTFQRNGEAISSLEKDVRQAASVGQVRAFISLLLII